MLLSPINGVVLRVPFYNNVLFHKFGGVSSVHSKFRVKNYLGFGIRFLNREQQDRYLGACSIAKVLGLTGAAYIATRALLSFLD